MGVVNSLLRRVSSVLNIVAGIAVTFMMFLTVVDVGLRAGGYPIVGTYEIVALSLAIVIGFSIPQVSLDRAHVFMEIGLEKLSPKGQIVMKTFTRLLCIGLFLFMGYNLFSVGAEFHSSGEVSQTLKLPFFPVAYGVGVCCFLECVVFVMEIVDMWKGGEHV
jgi:TRAP-type C4-dicarboxylate transport system permease small subunit